MKKHLLLFVFISLLALFSCAKSIDLEGFDVKTWMEDKGGCGGERKKLTGELIKIKKKFKGHTSEDIVATLGRPDREDLYSRNQKFYYYYIEPGIHCESGNMKKSDAEYVAFRLRAMNRVTEVNFEIKR
jgi:hypothetical protein